MFATETDIGGNSLTYYEGGVVKGVEEAVFKRSI